MTNAIIMASGMGTRMRPLTEYIPKPLIKVDDTPMIETVINGLLKRKIDNIYVVVGYLGDQFNYLKSKYSNVEIINNPDYETVNNISSIYYAREILKKGDCYICEADLYVSQESIFNISLDASCYYGRMVKGLSEDWVFEQDIDGYITRVGKVGTDCYNMVGIAFFKDSDAEILAKIIEEAYGTLGYEDKFWDDIVNENIKKFRISIHPISEGEIIEIDTVEELKAVQNSLRKLS